MARTIAALAVAAALLLTGCGTDDEDVVLVRSSIDGTPVADSTPRNPIELDPTEVSTLVLDVENRTDEAIEIGRVRLLGELLDLTFLTYDVRVSTPVAAGEQRQIEVPLDFFDLERQASGFLRASVRTYDPNGEELSSESLVLDVRGDVTSTMSLFALLLLLLTVLSAARNLRDTTKGTLPANRFVRGLRFGLTGMGVGLVISVAFSILRIFALPASGWIPITLATTAAGFAFGYLATGGNLPTDWDGDEPWDDDLDPEEAAVAAAAEDGPVPQSS